MIRHILTVSTGTLASRTLGFTRDALIAAMLGAGPVADAFLVAFQFINVARRIDGASIAGAEERLRTLIRLHIQVVLSPEDREITVMLHENHPLPPALRRKINARKKDYLHFVEHLIADVQRKRNSPSSVTPRAAALALVGMINWIYQWYKPEGPLTGDALVQQYTEIFFRGAVG